MFALQADGRRSAVHLASGDNTAADYASSDDNATSHTEPKEVGNNIHCRLENILILEPVISWRTHVVRTFIEVPDPCRHAGARREQSCPAKVVAGKAVETGSSRPSSAQSEPMRPAVTQERVGPSSVQSKASRTGDGASSEQLQPVPAG